MSFRKLISIRHDNFEFRFTLVAQRIYFDLSYILVYICICKYKCSPQDQRLSVRDLVWLFSGGVSYVFVNCHFSFQTRIKHTLFHIGLIVSCGLWCFCMQCWNIFSIYTFHLFKLNYCENGFESSNVYMCTHLCICIFVCMYLPINVCTYICI